MTLSYTDELTIKQESSPSRQRVLRRAAESWGTVSCESLAVDAIAAALIRRGWVLNQRGDNGSWYGRGPAGEDTRIADHLGHDCHAIDLVVDTPMTRVAVWRHVAETVVAARS